MNRCSSMHKKLGRCLRQASHMGPHYYANLSLKKLDPNFWDALQDPFSVVFFKKPYGGALRCIVPGYPSTPMPDEWNKTNDNEN